MDNIFNAAKPFCVVLSAIGLFPLSFDGPVREGHFVVKWHGIMALCCNVVILIVLLVLNVMSSFNFADVSVLLNLLWKIQAVSGNLLIFIQIFYQIYKRHNIVCIVTALHSFDEKVNKSYGSVFIV